MNQTRGPTLVLLAVLALFPGGKAHGDDIDTLRVRLRTDYLSRFSWGAGRYRANQRTDGSWADIDYRDRSRTAWEPITHLRRLRRIAVAYGRAKHSEHDLESLRVAVSKGLDYWFAKKAASDNWWYNDIGQQLELGPLLIVMQDALSSMQLERECHYLNDPKATGQNLVWYATQTVQRGCLRHSLADIRRGLDAINSVVRISTEEGVQPDFSFHQHGPQLYNGGYGRGFVNDVAYWIYMSRGLSFAFSEEKISILSKLMLEGTQWMVRRGHLDMACRRPGYHTSVKMSSTRTIGTEYMNGENRKAYYLPFGATPILRTGDEYHNIYPIWDWARIPGVTCPYKDPPPEMKTYIEGTTQFVGGVSNGTYGIAAMDLDWDGAAGRKAWFYFDNEFVALGAAISRTARENVITSINQCHMRGDVWSGSEDGGETTFTPGTHMNILCCRESTSPAFRPTRKRSLFASF